MSYGKFASITSSLLARKGEAAPWNGSGTPPPERFQEKSVAPFRPEPRPHNDSTWHMEPAASIPHRVEPPRLAPVPPPAHAPDDVRRCTVKLSQRDYERLGLMAVKKDVTRQQFLQSALARLLDEIAQEFPNQCACIGEGCGGCGKTG